MTGSADDKRRTARAALSTLCPANFSRGGVVYQCVMLNISEFGAGFSIDDPSHEPGLEVGDELSIEVLSPYGSGTCRGEVIWAHKLLGRASWGIKFTEVSDDPEDAFRALIDAPF